MSALIGSGDLDLSAALTTVPLIAGEENRHLVSSAMGFAWTLNDGTGSATSSAATQH